MQSLYKYWKIDIIKEIATKLRNLLPLRGQLALSPQTYVPNQDGVFSFVSKINQWTKNLFEIWAANGGKFFFFHFFMNSLKQKAEFDICVIMYILGSCS